MKDLAERIIIEELEAQLEYVRKTNRLTGKTIDKLKAENEKLLKEREGLLLAAERAVEAYGLGELEYLVEKARKALK